MLLNLGACNAWMDVAFRDFVPKRSSRSRFQEDPEESQQSCYHTYLHKSIEETNKTRFLPHNCVFQNLQSSCHAIYVESKFNQAQMKATSTAGKHFMSPHTVSNHFAEISSTDLYKLHKTKQFDILLTNPN